MERRENALSLCERCFVEGGKRSVVEKRWCRSDDSSGEASLGLVPVMKHVWRGHVLECPVHGVIHRTGNWFSGESLPRDKVRQEAVHIWDGMVCCNFRCDWLSKFCFVGSR